MGWVLKSLNMVQKASAGLPGASLGLRPIGFWQKVETHHDKHKSRGWRNAQVPDKPALAWVACPCILQILICIT